MLAKAIALLQFLIFANEVSSSSVQFSIQLVPVRGVSTNGAAGFEFFRVSSGQYLVSANFCEYNFVLYYLK
jgi:hypothetical protein